MAKIILPCRQGSIFLAPDIIGCQSDDGRFIVTDSRNKKILNPLNIDDKIYIYKRQVKEWFLKKATSYTKGKNSEFAVLMICLSYIEGVEQYRSGEQSKHHSRDFFNRSICRICPDLNREIADKIYNLARCGLFHDGMIGSYILLSYKYSKSINVDEYGIVEINPKLLLDVIKRDFDNYLCELKKDDEMKENFNKLYILTP
jgi:hypothetical protein